MTPQEQRALDACMLAIDAGLLALAAESGTPWALFLSATPESAYLDRFGER
jgi:hypothetical protein